MAAQSDPNAHILPHARIPDNANLTWIVQGIETGGAIGEVVRIDALSPSERRPFDTDENAIP